VCCVDSPRLVGRHIGVIQHQTLSSRAVFDRFQCLDQMRQRVFQYLRWFGANSHFFPLLFSPHLNFHANPLKIQEQPFNFFWFFIFGPFLFYYIFFILNNLLNLIPIFWLLFFYLVSFFLLILFYDFHPYLLSFFSYKI